jgi:hypothetical protein
MSELRSGNIVIRFKRPQGNGRAAMELTPMALMRRLASLVPPPGSHDTTYHGVFAAHARLRKRLVRPGRMDPETCRSHAGCEPEDAKISMDPEPSDPLALLDDRCIEENPEEKYTSWAKLLKRVHGLDMLKYECGGLRRIVRYLSNREKIREELEKLGLWREPPEVEAPVPSTVEGARRPAQEALFDDLPQSDGVDPPAPDDAA